MGVQFKQTDQGVHRKEQDSSHTHEQQQQQPKKRRNPEDTLFSLSLYGYLEKYYN